ncbi:MAG: ABC transporter substrate-binding protein [Spirochaetales bacterium]
MKRNGNVRDAVVTLALALMAVIAMPIAAADLSASLPAAVKAKGQIIVGINGIFPPMEYKEPGKDELIGFDVDFANAIGKALGVKIVYDDQKFDQLVNSVITSRVDMVISGISDTATRQKTLDFIDYFNSGTQAYTTKTYASTITSLESLSGKTLAVSASTDYLTTMEKWSKDNLEAKGKPGIKILAVDSEATARLQMVQGRAQASAISPEVLGWLAKQNPGMFVAFGPLLNVDPYGICFKKDNVGLRDAVLAAVRQLFADGTYKALLAKWELLPGALAEPLVNGKK